MKFSIRCNNSVNREQMRALTQTCKFVVSSDDTTLQDYRFAVLRKIAQNNKKP